jgi:hypothetical protein
MNRFAKKEIKQHCVNTATTIGVKDIAKEIIALLNQSSTLPLLW